MSYYTDHMAWQQRVAQEFKASSQYLENVTSSHNPSVIGVHPDLYLYTSLTSGPKNDMRRSFNKPFHPYNSFVHQSQNGQELPQTPLNGGNNNQSSIITKKDLLRQRSTTAKNGKRATPQNVNQTQNLYSYVPRSKASQRSHTQSKINVEKNQQVNSIDPQVQRFNEAIETMSRKSGPKSIISRFSTQRHGNNRPQTSLPQQAGTQKVSLSKNLLQHHQQQQQQREKIIDAVDKLSEKDLEMVNRILKLDNQQQQNSEDPDQINDEQEELNDQINDLPEGLENQDKLETISRSSKQSKYSVYQKSELSRLSNKTYIQHLQKELEEEKVARQKLESELNDLRKLSSEISSHLGLNKK